MRQKKLVYYGKKCLIFLISVFILSVAVFYVARLAPGDPLISYYGDRTEKMSPEEREWAMEKLGLNEPISVQYVKWVKNAFHGEFGISFKYKQDVVEVIGGRIGNTLVLGGIGFIIMFAGALLLGILCAWYENRLADIAAAWTDYLHHCKQQGLHFIQPGRFVLPGDMAGAPALQFFPWPDVDAWASLNWRRPISTPMPECCASGLIITARKW